MKAIIYGYKCIIIGDVQSPLYHVMEDHVMEEHDRYRGMVM